MATNQDFDALIVRIGTATTTLENSVQAVAEGSAEVEEAVAQAQQAATNATTQATNAANSATQANTAVTNATTQATNAANSANAANTAKTDTQTIKQETQTIADNLLATAPFQEAPQDGSIYGRQNGQWSIVDTGGATPVTSVNGEAPDAQGNVTIEVPTLTSQLTNDSGFITASEVPASPVQEAPTDGQQYARQNGAWSVVESSGGGGGAWPAPWEFPQESGTDITIDGGTTYVPWTQWSFANPFKAQPFNILRRTTTPVVDLVTGYNAWFTGVANLGTLPAGKYYFGSQDFKSAAGGAALSGKEGVIYIENYGEGYLFKRAWAVTWNGSGTIGGMYVWRTASSGTWFPVGTQTA